MLSECFNGKVLNKTINPDEAVAYGAAVYADALNENGSNLNNVLLKDVTSLSLGVSVKGDIMSVVIPRNTKTPTLKIRDYYTAEDN